MEIMQCAKDNNSKKELLNAAIYNSTALKQTSYNAVLINYRVSCKNIKTGELTLHNSIKHMIN